MPHTLTASQFSVGFETSTFYPAFGELAVLDAPDRNPGKTHRPSICREPENPIIDARAHLTSDDMVASIISEDINDIIPRAIERNQKIGDPLFE
ncbi:hypothetical protein [Methylocystis bryophila]|uniref:Uncharacterized protein n=1 Tax=Methylocystis bryophila TaxID=655015 RepID=A0A1W6MXA8_9HYPH|nr:hypothetical protein [Methylocystis bryophila]ARN82228.1 hypothetical protein B1812_15320 [Methylocystis bryophila]BDV38367.1 hypothetical protein DSM21852_16200 [Methylocystis bryophila]